MDVSTLLSQIDKQGGLVGSIMVVTWIALGYAIKTLWQELKEERQELKEAREDLKTITESSTTAITKYTEQAAISSESLKTLVTLALNGHSKGS
jgi:hypothetical protein